MDIAKTVAFALICTVLIITIKQSRPEIAVVLTLAASVLVVFSVVPQLKALMDGLSRMSALAGIASNNNIGLVLKIIGISYIAEFGSQVCADAGEVALASKVELAAKVMIMLISMPIMFSLVDLIMRML